MADPLAERVLKTLFNPQRDIADNGAAGPNQGGYVNIRPQADGSYLTLALGVARADTALVERGVRALEYGLPQQKADGSFEGSSAQDVARFALLGTRGHNLLAHSQYVSAYATRLEAISSALLRTDTRLLDLLSQHPEIYEDTNQVAMLAYVFIIGGQSADNDKLLTKGDELLQWVLTVQREDGVFPERGGHDSHYQAVSLMALAHIYLYAEQASQTEAVYTALEAGFEWQKGRISPSGRVMDEGNTRTANNPDLSPEGKQIDPREIALALLYLSYLEPELSEARHLSDTVLDEYLQGRP